jgi:hypothetical protein
MANWYIFPVLVCCTKKNLATLRDQNEKDLSAPSLNPGFRGPFLTSPLGANFDPQGRSWSPGVNFVP